MNAPKTPASKLPYLLILAVWLISAGMQTIFLSFFLSVLGLKISNRTPPSPQ